MMVGVRCHESSVCNHSCLEEDWFEKESWSILNERQATFFFLWIHVTCALLLDQPA
jgi:hypothetical protein